ncbi:hypothetical protein OBBRIDRAFT_16026 [Obba rivulosa]|uniref:Uncharacterized protein n=1 Tax=Obba rivulosa TaxID=1052685 RepID=A0A8E2DVW3_9APHY|nr:hypothetical protein OBBRIDRAFT_16026 [Obba rivulosa]
MLADTEDEFDALPDEFEGIVWDNVPEMAPSSGSSQATIPHEQGTIPSTPGDEIILGVAPHTTRRQSSPSSSHYSFDELDQAFLDEVDVLFSRTSHSAHSGTVTFCNWCLCKYSILFCCRLLILDRPTASLQESALHIC